MHELQIYKKSDPYLRNFIGHIIILEGTISSGKTTLGNHLHQLFAANNIKSILFPEYVNETFLNKYISDMPKYAFSFQITMLRERIRLNEKASQYANEGYVTIVDRSFIGDLAFALLQKNKNFIGEDEWEIYTSMLEEGSKLEPSAIVYLDVGAEEAKKRNIKRNNLHEIDGYDLQYYLDLEKAYQEAEEYSNVKMIRYDWSENREMLEKEDLYQFLEFVYQKISKKREE